MSNKGGALDLSTRVCLLQRSVHREACGMASVVFIPFESHVAVMQQAFASVGCIYSKFSQIGVLAACRVFMKSLCGNFTLRFGLLNDFSRQWNIADLRSVISEFPENANKYNPRASFIVGTAVYGGAFCNGSLFFFSRDLVLTRHRQMLISSPFTNVTP